jgi:hypothetical protein
MEPKKLGQRQIEQTQVQQQSTQQAVLELGSVEEVLRYDAAQVTPPTRLARRLSDSISRECKTARSWWKRLWGRTDER